MNDVVLRYGVSTSTGSTGSAGSETGSP
jgi:hypothetical protein